MSLTQQLLTNKGVRWIAAGWTGFILENLVLSHNRADLIRLYGDDNYHMVYNILSTLACSSIGFGFFRYGKVGGAVLPRRGPAGQLLGLSLQALGLACLSQLAPTLQVPVGMRSADDMARNDSAPSPAGKPAAAGADSRFFVRCPMDFRPKSSADGLNGMDRVTRHPALWAFGATALGSAVTAVYLPHAVMFSFPILFTYIGTSHQDYRHRRNNGGRLSPATEAVTSNLPFQALLEGRQSWRALGEEVKWTNACVAGLAAVGLALRRARALV